MEPAPGVRSLGFRTDLMVLGLKGGVVERRDGYFVVRTRANPTFHWGNFLLLDGPPEPGTVATWMRRFHREFPGAGHLALGVDGTAGAAGDPDELAKAGLEIERSAVMTATTVGFPSHPNRDTSLRILDGDRDWAGALALREANNEGPATAEYREYAQRSLAAARAMQERGAGAWFGAFDGDQMVSGLGIFTDGSGIARYQSVDTHPDHRRRGLAGTLVHAAGRYAVERLGARTLVIVADPDYVAIRVYRSVGFTDVETQVQLSRSR